MTIERKLLSNQEITHKKAPEFRPLFLEDKEVKAEIKRLKKQSHEKLEESPDNVDKDKDKIKQESAKKEEENNTEEKKKTNKYFDLKLEGLGKTGKKEETKAKIHSDSDIEDLFNEEPDYKNKKIKKNSQNFNEDQKNLKIEKEMNEKINKALKNEEIKKEEKSESLEENEEEELNSNDDPTDYENEVDPGSNILLAYYDKYTRKKDKRKMWLKHCVLRVEEMDMILPLAKGDFTWVAAKNRYN